MNHNTYAKQSYKHIRFAPNMQDIEDHFNVFRPQFSTKSFQVWHVVSSKIHACCNVDFFFRSCVFLAKGCAKSAVPRILMSAKMLCNVVSVVAGLLVTRIMSSLFLLLS